MKKPTHKWAFRPRFRANAFGWKASKLASQRLKEALTEIKAVARVDPLIVADGAILLMEKIWPALAHVDSSSGALGNAVNKTVRELLVEPHQVDRSEILVEEVATVEVDVLPSDRGDALEDLGGGQVASLFELGECLGQD